MGADGSQGVSDGDGEGVLYVADLGARRLRPRPGPALTVVTVGRREVRVSQEIPPSKKGVVPLLHRRNFGVPHRTSIESGSPVTPWARQGLPNRGETLANIETGLTMFQSALVQVRATTERCSSPKMTTIKVVF